MDISDLKAAARREAAARRHAVHGRDDGEAGTRLATRFRQAITPSPGAVVSGYWPIRDEVDTRPLMDLLHAAGHPIGLPVIVGRDTPLVFRAWRPGEPLIDGTFATSVPPESAPEVTPEILLVPLLAFDRTGYRLGYGGGFYDRTIGKLRAAGGCLAVGVAYAGQQVDDVPRDPFDQPLDRIITDRDAIVPAGAP